MDKGHTIFHKLLSIAGLLLLFFPCVTWGLWVAIGSSREELSRAERTRVFLEFFPAALQTTESIAVAALVCCLLAVVFGTIGLKSAKGFYKGMGVLTLLIAAFVGFLTMITFL